MILKKTTLLLIICFSLFLNLDCDATDWQVISLEQYLSEYSRAIEYFDGNKYSVSYKFTSYAGHEATVPHESRNGFCMKDGDNLFMRLDQQLIVQNAEVRLSINQDEKLFLISEPEKKSDFDADLAVFEVTMKNAKKIEKKVSTGRTILKLTYNGFAGMEYQEVVLNENGLIVELISYYSEAIPLDPNVSSSKMIKPKVKLEFSNFTKEFDLSNEMKVEKFVKIDKKRISPIGVYATYQILNLKN